LVGCVASCCNVKDVVLELFICSFILVRDRTVGIEDKLWYSSEEVDYFKAEANFIVRDVRRKLSKLCLHSGGTDDISSLLDY
jgi:hypothetical protein